MQPAPRPTLSRRLAAIAALAVLASLSGCGGDSDRSDASLASLDTRLTNSAVVDGAHQAPGPTLASLAHSQAAENGGGPVSSRDRLSGACASDVRYGDQWARAMPAAFAVYPGGNLVEAAGIDNDHCTLRVVSFTTADAPDAVIRHYQARARSAGYDAERQLCKGEHRLGGVRAADGAAYMLYTRRTAKGVTEVDIVTGNDV